jgi:multidrug efflux pump subunit AcrB
VPSISIAFNLRLSDVAEVRRGYEDPPTLLIRHQGEPALALGVVRRQAAREFASPKVRFAIDSMPGDMDSNLYGAFAVK